MLHQVVFPVSESAIPIHRLAPPLGCRLLYERVVNHLPFEFNDKFSARHQLDNEIRQVTPLGSILPIRYDKAKMNRPGFCRGSIV